MAENGSSSGMPQFSEGHGTEVNHSAEPQRARSFPCASCGADLQFNVGVQSLKCPYCGFVKDLDVDPQAAVQEQDFAAMLEHLAAQRAEARPAEEPLSEVRCDSCGGTVQFTGTLTSSECTYCGVPIQRQNVHDSTQRVPVDGVVPFMVDRAKAQTNLQTWVRSRWFAPNALKARGVQGRFNGIYLPFWTYDAATATHYSGERGEHYWVTEGSGDNKRRKRRTRWHPESGHFQRFFDDLLVVAGTGIPLKRLVALEPWPFDKGVPFNSQILAGFFARTYDVALDAGFEEAKGRIEEALEHEVRQRIGGDEQRVHDINTSYNAITYKHLLLPVWMMAYRYGDRSYQVLVNAATGEVQGDRPYSTAKIVLTVLAVLAAAAGAVLIFG